jgi:hypothetical protein
MGTPKTSTRPNLIERQDDLRVFEGEPPQYKLAALALVTLRKIAVTGAASGTVYETVLGAAKYWPWHLH